MIAVKAACASSRISLSWVSELKIDRSFVKALPHSGQPLVTAIISMTHSFGLTVGAAGTNIQRSLHGYAREVATSYRDT